MKIFQILLEIGVDDDITSDKLQERINIAIQEDIPEMKFFKINGIKPIKTASGQYKLSLDEAKRLNLDKIK